MINVDIYVPSLDEVLDFQLDETVSTSLIIREIQEILCKRMKETIESEDSQFMLCLPEQERVLSFHLSLQENGVINGNRLLLV